MNRFDTALTIHEVSSQIQQALDLSFPSFIWVVGEINEISENRSGHCYLELIEKDSKTDSPKAKIRATIWSRTYRLLKPFFETSTGRRLSSGIKVMVQCQVTFHAIYGLSLNITDIDPTFTLGDIERVRQITIEKLIADGVMDMNKELGFPMLPKRIAVVSSPTAAGYEDFAHQIASNPYGYRIALGLFSAVMQGDKAEESIIQALNRIHNQINQWDVVAIIRGGGSQSDLACFDSYNLASNIAQFSIPVLTGIGHEKDVTIADMVANVRLKTPTAVAEFIVQQFVSAETWLQEAFDNFTDAASLQLERGHQSLARTHSKAIPLVLKYTKSQESHVQKQMRRCSSAVIQRLHANASLLKRVSHLLISQQEKKLQISKSKLVHYDQWVRTKPLERIKSLKQLVELTERNISSLNPERVLERGFSISFKNGKAIKNSEGVVKGDIIQTYLSSGMLTSIVEMTTENRDKLA